MHEEAEYLAPLVAPLLKWYETNRRPLPWREAPTPYHVWVSEIMLQQTRVEAVKEYYKRFLRALPDLSALAEAPEEQLMKLWEGLGYYSRARNLQKAARIVKEQYGGELPRTVQQLIRLPGIGEYTAGAIASIAYGIPTPAVDGNVLRVLARCLAEEHDISLPKERRRLTEYVREILPVSSPAAFNQALMELGALICLPNGQPLCAQCPVSFLCRAFGNSNTAAYPIKSPKKPRKQTSITLWILQCGNHFLLEKRTEPGVLHGLWQFPNDESGISPEEKMRQWGIQPDSVTALPPARHIFTHIEWNMTAYLIRLREPRPSLGGEWANREEIRDRYSLPAAFRHYDRLIGLR